MAVNIIAVLHMIAAHAYAGMKTHAPRAVCRAAGMHDASCLYAALMVASLVPLFSQKSVP